MTDSHHIREILKTNRYIKDLLRAHGKSESFIDKVHIEKSSKWQAIEKTRTITYIYKERYFIQAWIHELFHLIDSHQHMLIKKSHNELPHYALPLEVPSNIEELRILIKEGFSKEEVKSWFLGPSKYSKKIFNEVVEVRDAMFEKYWKMAKSKKNSLVFAYTFSGHFRRVV